jgi:ABC-type amino acid transport substrate-binding protein
MQKGALFISFLILWGAVSAFGEETIRIATPSWEGQTNEDGTGLFFEIVCSVYEPAGIKMAYEIVPWKRAQMMVNSNKADAMVCVWQEHAEEQGQITPRYPIFVEYTAAVFKKKNFKEWKGAGSLNGRQAVWLRGYDYQTTSELKGVKFKWDEVDSYKQAWMLIEKERVDVYIDALIDLDQYIRQNQINMTPYGLEILWATNAYMAFGKSERSEKLIQIYDKRIIELFKSGELKRIYEKWNARFSPEPWQ